MPVKPNYHDFKSSLSYSDINTLELIAFYKHAFPGVVDVKKVTDLALQRQGVDTVVLLSNGKRIFFDEKVRARDYGDILLEEYSVWRGYPRINGNVIKENECVNNKDAEKYGLVVGWLGKTKCTDYITYIIKPTRRVYFLPFLLLQRTWCLSYSEWIALYGRKAAKNKDYYTTNVAIPIDVLYKALYEGCKW